MPEDYIDSGYDEHLQYDVSEDSESTEVSDLYTESSGTSVGSDSSNNVTNPTTDGISADHIVQSGTITGSIDVGVRTHIKGGADGYDDGEGFWLGWDPTLEEYVFFIGDSTGDNLTYNPTDGLTITGSLVAGSIHIPDKDTTDASFHVNTSGNAWGGATESDYNSDPTNANWRLNANGNVFFQNGEFAGTLKTTVFEKDVVSAVGGVLVVTNSDVLDVDMTALDASTLTIKGETTFAVNDILHIKDGTDEEYLRVTNIGSAPTYTVTRDLAGAYGVDSNPAWSVGTAVVEEGSSDGASTFSGGFLQLFGSGANSPKYSVFKRTGTAYNAVTEYVTLGNLNTRLDYVSEEYGIAIGTTATGFLAYDETNGLRVRGKIINNITLTCGEDIDDEMFIRIHTDGKAYYATALIEDLTPKMLAVALDDFSKDDTGVFQIVGPAKQTGLTVASEYYIDDGTIDQSFTSDNDETNVSTSYNDEGQTFTTGASTEKIDAIALYGRRNGSGCGNLTIEIYATSAGVPTGSALTSFVRDSGDFDTSNEWQVWHNDTPYLLSASTMYAMVLVPAGGDITNRYIWRQNSGGGYSGGTGVVDPGGGWVTNATDRLFRTYYFDGVISASPGTFEKEVGLALTTTELIMRIN